MPCNRIDGSANALEGAGYRIKVEITPAARFHKQAQAYRYKQRYHRIFLFFDLEWTCSRPPSMSHERCGSVPITRNPFGNPRYTWMRLLLASFMMLPE